VTGRVFLHCKSLIDSLQFFVDVSLQQGAAWSWEVMEFRKTIFQAWKVMENEDNVIEFLLLH